MMTIKDVARRAGVSVTTVSHVVNATRFVSEDAQRRVRAAIAELDYIPSAVARSLKVNRTHTVGMMIPNNSNPYFAEIIRGIEDTCFAAGFTVILCNCDDDPQKQNRYLRVLMEKQVDGLIIVSSGGEVELTTLLAGVHLPLVIVDREVPSVAADFVEVDHESGGRLATQHLIKLGHRDIACIAGPKDLPSSAQRLAGYLRALRDAKLAFDGSRVIFSDFTSRGGHDAMRQLLALRPRPSAVFVGNDLMALGAICAARDEGLRLPDDLSIVGFDDIELAAYTSPPLTTIEQPKHQMGALTARLLLERIANRDEPPRRKVLKPKLQLRRSTGAPHAARRATPQVSEASVGAGAPRRAVQRVRRP